jgi:hypothetical protein
MLVMMNVIVDFKNQNRSNDEEFLDEIQAQMRSSLMERVGFLLALLIYYKLRPNFGLGAETYKIAIFG